MFQAILFTLFSVAALASALVVVTRANPIGSAVALVVTFFFLAADYVLLDAHFVAVIQVLVYAGAIMVLFVFVIMLLNVRDDGARPLPHLGTQVVAGLAALGLIGTGMLVAVEAVSQRDVGSVEAGFGGIVEIGQALFGGTYLLPFEAVSALLTVAMVGAVVLGKKDL